MAGNVFLVMDYSYEDPHPNSILGADTCSCVLVANSLAFFYVCGIDLGLA